MHPLDDADLRAIAAAADYLENPKFLMRVAEFVGKPAEALLQRLPARAQAAVSKATDAAMHKALDLAISTLDFEQSSSPSAHSAGAALLGAASGFFGLPGLAIELPLSTAVMLRSIAAIAKQQGADLSDPAVRLECLTVLALGGQMPTPIDAVIVDGARDPALAESAYWSARLGLMVALREAALHVGKGTAKVTATELMHGAAPVVAKLLAKIAARFEIVVSEKAVAQSVPVIGAAAGAALNGAFAEHFNAVALHHFGLRRLERQSGEAAVRHAYAAAVQQRPQTPPKVAGRFKI